MKNNSIGRAVAFSMLACIATSTASASARCVPEVRDGWIRLTPGGMGMLAGYARVVNPCPSEAALIRADSKAFADTSMHESRLENGISHMRAVPMVRIAPNTAVDFKPGGLHLMLMQPTFAPKAGDQVPIDFSLRDGRRITGKFTVRAAMP
ncbi:MAG: hypothetical protein JWL98_1996 [Xanthomonadaceae bacterium]|nr:hypothetical protein [Xanthomonadaceae bacterium]